MRNNVFRVFIRTWLAVNFSFILWFLRERKIQNDFTDFRNDNKTIVIDRGLL